MSFDFEDRDTLNPSLLGFDDTFPSDEEFEENIVPPTLLHASTTTTGHSPVSCRSNGSDPSGTRETSPAEQDRLSDTENSIGVDCLGVDSAMGNDGENPFDIGDGNAVMNDWMASNERTEFVGVKEDDTKKRRKPKLDAELFCGGKKPNLPDEFQNLDEEEKDLIWDFYVSEISSFPTFEEKLVQERKKRRQSQLLSTSMREVNNEFTEEDLSQIRRTHIDSLLAIFRRWSQTTYPAGLSLADFARRMDIATHDSAFQQYRLRLLKKYKDYSVNPSPSVDSISGDLGRKAGLVESTGFDGLFDGDSDTDEENKLSSVLYAARNVQKPSDNQNPKTHRVSCNSLGGSIALTEEQKEIIRKRKEECLARHKLRKLVDEGRAVDLTQDTKVLDLTQTNACQGQRDIRKHTLTEEQRVKIAAAKQRALFAKQRRTVSTID